MTFTFAAFPNSESMSIGNAIMKFNVRPWLPSNMQAENIQIIIWTGEKGQIEYNDRPRIFDEFIDPAPYGAAINAWLRAAIEQGLLLAQAKAIKRDFVETIYSQRRKLPYDSYLGSTWVATEDDLTAAMARLVPQLFGSSSSTGLIADINRAIGEFNAIDWAFYTHYPSFSGFRWVGWTQQTSTLPASGGYGPVVTCNPVFAYQPQFQAASYSSFTTWHSSPQVHAPIVGWQGIVRDSGDPPRYVPANTGLVAGVSAPPPPGGGAAVIPWESVRPNQAKHMLTAPQASELMQLISDRNNWYLDRKFERLNHIELLSTQPDPMTNIINYDVTAGW